MISSDLAAVRRPQIAEAAQALIDDQLGIIRHIGMARRHAGAPRFFHYWCEASDTSAFVPQRNFARTGGAATDPDRALAKALGEAVERYCAAIYDVEELPVCSADEAAFECADPNTFALNSPGQYAERGFAFVPFDATTSVRWVAARDALTTAEIFVPAAMVFVPYYYVPGSGDSPISQPISTGLACHESFEQAATVALCEVIERDAFMIAWQAGLTPPRLELGFAAAAEPGSHKSLHRSRVRDLTAGHHARLPDPDDPGSRSSSFAGGARARRRSRSGP